MEFGNHSNSRRSVALTAAVVVLAGMAMPISPVWGGEWRITPRVTVEEKFTDNVFGDATGTQSDVITTASGGAGIRGDGGRIHLTLDYDVLRDTYVDNSELNGFRQNMLGSGKAELWKDHLFLDAQAAISQENLTRSGRASGTDRNLDRNQTQVLNYSFSPSLKHGNDGWADSVLLYRFSEVRFFATDQGPGSSAADNSRTHQFTTYLKSGRRFTRLLWKLSASTSITHQKDKDNSRNKATNLSGEYVVNRQLSILGGIGHEDRSDPGLNNNQNSGLTWRGGVRARPGPRTSARLEYVHRFGGRTWSGDLTYKVGPQTTLMASYEEEIRTEQQALNANLLNLVRLPDGTLVDGRTGLPVDPNDPRFDLVDDSFRSKNFSLGLSGKRGRNTFSVSGFHNTRDFEARGETETILGVTASLKRRLSPTMNAGVGANFSADSGGGASSSVGDRTFGANATVGYSFTQDLNGSLNYNFFNRNSNDSNDDLRENVVSVRLSKTF